MGHRLEGCTFREPCPVSGARSCKDFRALLDTPPIPAKTHPEGFALKVPRVAHEERGLVSGEAFSDGSVEWPREHCLASGGLAIAQVGEEGAPIRWHAATLCTDCRHVAAHTEMLAMAVAVVPGSEDGELDLWVDCQAVVSGFANPELVADDYTKPICGHFENGALCTQGKRLSHKGQENQSLS